jgi:hypothetical protein
LAWYPIVEENRAPMLRLMTRLVNAARLPRAQGLQEVANYEKDVRVFATDKRRKLTALYGINITKFFAFHDKYVALVECARTALAAEAFRCNHGHWPADLNDLVPAYLQSIPLDPYSGQQLQMVKRDDGLVIYCVGDEPAKIADEAWNDHASRPFFRLWNEDQRAKPNN